jgi:NhaP-type Na+/H+ or K+/H+ antiporter
MLIIIGILLGLALYFDHQQFYELNTTTFFLVLLPPIILDAGYFMPARPFFDQLGKKKTLVRTKYVALLHGFT